MIIIQVVFCLSVKMYSLLMRYAVFIKLDYVTISNEMYIFRSASLHSFFNGKCVSLYFARYILKNKKRASSYKSMFFFILCHFRKIEKIDSERTTRAVRVARRRTLVRRVARFVRSKEVWTIFTFSYKIFCKVTL